jgi:MFS family permease
MFQRTSFGKSRTNRKLATANILLVASAFIWYYIAFFALKTLLSKSASPSETLLIFGINTGAIVLSGLIGSFVVDKFKKRSFFLYVWLSIGIVISVVPLGLNVANIIDLTIVSLIFGLYFGIGMPATMGYHSSFTCIEDRAKLGGLAFLIINATFAIVSFLIIDSLLMTCVILASIQILALVIFHFTHVTEESNKEVDKIKFRSIISNKSFILYFFPWLMITLINYMTIPILRATTNAANITFLSPIENIIIALVAVISGFVADKYGRKRLLIIGFVMLGIGYAAIGFASSPEVSAIQENLIFGSIIYYVADGIAWGIFYVLFLFTIWGDLAQNRNSDKLFFLGALPFVSSYIMQLLFSPYLSKIDLTLVFTFISVFLFLAVLPLIYAPETLPEKLMKDRDLKSYIENAKKKAQKETGNNKKKEKPVGIEEDEELAKSEDGKEYDDAVKLAEKYY